MTTHNNMSILETIGNHITQQLKTTHKDHYIHGTQIHKYKYKIIIQHNGIFIAIDLLHNQENIEIYHSTPYSHTKKPITIPLSDPQLLEKIYQITQHTTHNTQHTTETKESI